MAYGLRVWAANGSLRLDMTDRLFRLIFDRLVAADESGSVSLPAYDSNRGAHIAFLVDIFEAIQGVPLFGMQKIVHDLAWNNSTKVLTWTPFSNANYQGASRIQVWMYA